MTDAEIKAMIERLIKREGGYVDHPNDAGGCTNMGITRATLQAHRGRETSCADVRALHIAEAVAVYRKSWFDHDRLRLAQWPYRKLAEVTLDAAIMFSLGREMSVKWVQSGINALHPNAGPLKVDGWAGPGTLAAMVMCDQHKLVSYVIAERCRKHARVVKASPSQAAFIEGWINRATGWLMVANGAATEAPKLPVHDTGPYVLATTYAHDQEYWTGGSLRSSGQELLVTHRDPAKADHLADMAAVDTVRKRYLGLRTFTVTAIGGAE